jgi:hypothetical protein
MYYLIGATPSFSLAKAVHSYLFLSSAGLGSFTFVCTSEVFKLHGYELDTCILLRG